MRTGQRIAHRRKEVGLSQASLAEKTGIQKMRIHRIEHDVGRGALATELRAIADALATTVPALLGDHETHAQPQE